MPKVFNQQGITDKKKNKNVGPDHSRLLTYGPSILES